MKFMTATMFLSGLIDDKEMSGLNYLRITNAVPEIVELSFSTERAKERGSLNLDNIKEYSLDDEVGEEISKENIMDFIETMLEGLRSTNTIFSRGLTDVLITSGRERLKK